MTLPSPVKGTAMLEMDQVTADFVDQRRCVWVAKGSPKTASLRNSAQPPDLSLTFVLPKKLGV